MTFIAILGFVFAVAVAILTAFLRVIKPQPVVDLIPMTPEPYTPPAPSPTIPVVTKDMPKIVYNAAKSFIGEHLALNSTVKPEEGCVTAVAFVLNSCGYKVPKTVVGTLDLMTWMIDHGFEETDVYTTGAIITAHNVSKTVTTGAHVGVCGTNWIMSNTSYTDASKGLKQGIWDANFQKQNWAPYYASIGSVTKFFIPVDKAPTT